jgi:hypothetical protein
MSNYLYRREDLVQCRQAAVLLVCHRQEDIAQCDEVSYMIPYEIYPFLFKIIFIMFQ